MRAVGEASALLAQCGVMTRFDAPRMLPADAALDTPRSAVLAATLPPGRPALFFVGETRNRPAFEAEAFGIGNTRSRPVLAGTVWVTRHARDLPLVIAHELAHVLMDSGEHVNEPGNLMAEETSPRNASLTAAQCDRLRRKGAENGWLQPL